MADGDIEIHLDMKADDMAFALSALVQAFARLQRDYIESQKESVRREDALKASEFDAEFWRKRHALAAANSFFVELRAGLEAMKARAKHLLGGVMEVHVPVADIDKLLALLPGGEASSESPT